MFGPLPDLGSDIEAHPGGIQDLNVQELNFQDLNIQDLNIQDLDIQDLGRCRVLRD
jgi:hypothetical protein